MALNRALLVLLTALCAHTVWAQSPAALDKVLARYTAEELQEMQQRAHYRYVGLLLFYAESFLVKEDGAFRTATEAEITAIDLDQYNASRAEVEDVVVFDNALGTDVLLRSREHFEEIYLAQLTAHDRSAFHAYKSAARPVSAKAPR